MKTVMRIFPLVTVCAAVLTACGGGSGGPITQQAAPHIAGIISGLGSVVVNGVRYETIGASVVDSDNDSPITSALGLGMTIGIDPLSTNPTVAKTIQIKTGLKGPASGVDIASSSLLVAGLPVVIDSSTFVVTAAGTVGQISNLANSQNLEVYGIPQSDGTFKATRIEIETSAQNIQLLGTVVNLNTGTQTFNLGSAGNIITVTYSDATVPAGLANGSVVSIHTSQNAGSTQYAASLVYLRADSVSTFEQYTRNYAGTSRDEREANELYGMVSGLTSQTAGCTLQVQGVPTTLTSANLCASIQNGDYVEVKGRYTNGTLNAYRVEFKTAGVDRQIADYHDDENDQDDDGMKYRRQTHDSYADNDDDNSGSTYEIYGELSACGTNTCTLTTNGSVLTADLSTAYWEHGRVESGRVEAKGYMTGANTFKVVKIESKR